MALKRGKAIPESRKFRFFKLLSLVLTVALVVFGLPLITPSQRKMVILRSGLKPHVYQLQPCSMRLLEEWTHRVSDNEELNTLRENAVSIHLSRSNINIMTPAHMNMTLHSILSNIDTICTRSLRMGGTGLNGAEVCDDPDVVPENPCVVYSLGNKNDFRFENDINRYYGCEVYIFEGHTQLRAHNRSKHVHFYNYGIGRFTGGVGLSDTAFEFKTLRDRMGHGDTPIDVIKLNLDSAEWRVLYDLMSTDSLTNVKQIYIRYSIQEPAMVYGLMEKLKIIQGLENHGFRKFHVRKEERCRPKVAHCYSVHYIHRPC